METSKAIVARIRPVSWKICVSGAGCADYVRNTLHESGISCSKAIREPELQNPPIFSFIAVPKAETPLTAPELQDILIRDSKIEVAFEA